MGFPGGSVARNLPAIQEPHETRVRSCVSKIPWRRTWQPTPVLLPGESPWTEEAGRLPSMGSHRVGQDWAQVFMNKGGSWDTEELLQQWPSSEEMSMDNPDPALMLPPLRWPGTQRVGRPRTQSWDWTRRGKHGRHQPRDAGQAKGSSPTARQSAGNEAPTPSTTPCPHFTCISFCFQTIWGGSYAIHTLQMKTPRFIKVNNLTSVRWLENSDPGLSCSWCVHMC